MNLLRLVRVVLALPGRLVIRWLDLRRLGNGLRPMGGFLRGSVHGFIWVIALMMFSMATVAPSPEPAPSAARVAPRYVPPAVPADVFEPMPTASPAPVDEPTDEEIRIAVEEYLREDSNDGDGRESRFCRGKWWC